MTCRSVISDDAFEFERWSGGGGEFPATPPITPPIEPLRRPFGDAVR
jgi:hypothetical protein